MGSFFNIVFMNGLIKIQEHDYMAMQTQGLAQKRRCFCDTVQGFHYCY